MIVDLALCFNCAAVDLNRVVIYFIKTLVCSDSAVFFQANAVRDAKFVFARSDAAAVKTERDSIRSDADAARAERGAIRPDDAIIRAENVAVCADGGAVCAENAPIRTEITNKSAECVCVIKERVCVGADDAIVWTVGAADDADNAAKRSAVGARGAVDVAARTNDGAICPVEVAASSVRNAANSVGAFVLLVVVAVNLFFAPPAFDSPLIAPARRTVERFNALNCRERAADGRTI